MKPGDLSFLKQSPRSHHFITVTKPNPIRACIHHPLCKIKRTKDISIKISVAGYIPNIAFLKTLYLGDVV
ncbi:hypothetical protein D3C86_2109290 [compost metagenome]